MNKREQIEQAIKATGCNVKILEFRESQSGVLLSGDHESIRIVRAALRKIGITVNGK